MSVDVVALEAELRRSRRPHVRATVVATMGTVSARAGDKAVVTADGRLSGWVGGSCAEPAVRREAIRVLADDVPRLLHLGPPADLPEPTEAMAVAPVSCASEGTLQVFLEPWAPPTHLVVVGRAPMVQALVTMAAALGFEVVVVEREPLSPAEVASLGGRVVADLDLEAAGTGPGSYIVVATMGRYDEDAVEAALATGAGFVAMVGSARRAATVLDALRAAGVGEEDLARVRSPAGVDLGRLPHAEIAVSVLAGIVAHKAAAVVARSAAAPPAAPPAAEVTDPVCGMSVTVGPATPRAEHEGTAYWFCCAGCRRRFERDPASFLAPAAGPAGAGEGTP